MTNALERLAAFIAEAPRDYGAAGLFGAGRALLDTLGCMILGAGTSVADAARRSQRDSGNGPAAVIGRSERLPAASAALVNAAAAHAYDLDDYEEAGNTHPSAVLFPALLAIMAAEEDRPGTDLLDAYLVGLEAIMRLGEAVNMSHYNRGWHSTGTLGSLGAAAACARALGLGAPQAAHALSLATSLGGGYVSQFGTMAKPLHAGMAAQNGILAARLAAAGATGSASVLDGPVSFASLLVGEGEARFEPALAKLGRPWAIAEHGVALKAYACCGYIHRVIDGALTLKANYGLRPDDIAAVTLSLPDFHLAILPFHQPSTPAEALFSPAYCVATVFTNGALRVDDFTAEAVARTEVQRLIERITLSGRPPKDPSRNMDPTDPDRVSLTLRDGRQLTAEVPLPLGAPGNPMTPAQVEAKFYDNATRSLPKAQARAIRDATAALAKGEPLDVLLKALVV